ncbi:MAG TPA: hypothetical protein VHE30_23000 [Polyangiaceae bacterium]|nr:hypothetical protein [Polyangiaceae bacterium]
MLTRDVRVEGFDASDFVALGRLFSPAEPPTGEPRGGLVVLVDRGHVVKLFSTLTGRLAPVASGALLPLEALALEHRAVWAIRVERGSLPEISDRFARRLERKDTFLAQSLKMLGILKELAEEGALETHPRDLRRLTLPRESTVERVLDAVCPVGKTLLLCAFEGEQVVTSLALHRARGGFDRVVGPCDLRRDRGLVSTDWTKNVAGYSRAVELAVGPLALGCFAEEKTFLRLARTTAPGAWASAVASRDVVFHPVAPALAIPLGVDVGRAALSVAREVAVRFGLAFSSDGPFGPALERVRDASRGGQADLVRLLGFDPVTLFRDFLSRDQVGD